MSVWTDHPELVEKLKGLYIDDGLSASWCARALGHGISRNSVIGKVTRMKWPLRGIEAPRISKRYRKKKSDNGFILPSAGASRSKVKSAALVPVQEPEAALILEGGAHITVLTVTDRHCRWPIGDPAASEFHFCGHNPKAGSLYCEAHARKAYQPPLPRRVDHRQR